MSKYTLTLTARQAADVPNEKGSNRYGLDMAYFRRLFNRELNIRLSDYRPDELARVLARAARAADREVLGEAEFRTDAGIPVSSLGRRKAAEVGKTIGVLVQNQDGKVAAVTDLGRCTWLNQDVTGAGAGVTCIADWVKGAKKYNVRGFQGYKQKDLYGHEYSIQKSSLATENCIWFGVNDAAPVVMASDAKRLGVSTDETCGWVPFPVPVEVSMHTRMHLSQRQVRDLLPVLQCFADSGDLPEPPKQEKSE